MSDRPDIVILMTDEERAVPPYESDEVLAWRRRTLSGRRWFDEHGVSFRRHYTGSLACVPSRPTLFTGHYPDVHGVTQTDGLGKMADDSRMRWLRAGEVPTLGNWFRAGGYDTHYDGKWHISHADLHDESGDVLATNDGAGEIDPAAVARYLDADPLDPFGFSGWVGPEPHGARLADSGLRRDPLIADRVVAWLEDRYARRQAGDTAARRPFLLVASFVNPHDIVLFPTWLRRSPLAASPLDPPAVPAPPTAAEDLSTKPAAQIAYRETYYSGYGPAAAVARAYQRNDQRYRDLYYRLHAEVDGPLDRVRRAVTDGGSEQAVVVRTSDHGELLGAHGGLHQKWFNLYDEATRVPFVIARIGDGETAPRTVEAPTSHVDLVPTLLAAAGIDAATIAAELAETFSEVHDLPGRDLMPVVDGAAADDTRAVYLMTRDNMLEGDSGASGTRAQAQPHGEAAGAFAHPGSGPRRRELRGSGRAGHRRAHARRRGTPVEARPYLRRSGHVDPARRSSPGGRRTRGCGVPDLAARRPVGAVRPHRGRDRGEQPLDRPRPGSGEGPPPQAVATRTRRLDPRTQRAVALRRASTDGGPTGRDPAPPARALRRLVRRLGMHPVDVDAASTPELIGRRALVVCTNHGILDIGKPTGVFASEMTAPYYAFLDAGMEVDIASPRGGAVPVDPRSLKPVLRSEHDDRFLADDELRAKVTDSLAVGDLDIADYDIVFLAGGWGAAFDLGFSEELADQITRANELGRAIGGVCHGPLGLRNARTADGRPLVEGRKISAVTDKQVRELGIGSTPQHPETEMRAMGAIFESETRFRDPLANHWVVDGNLVTGQNQNAGPMVARELMSLVAAGTTTTHD